jgi:hypothetical protein
MARRDDNDVRLYTRNGYDFAGRYPQIVEAVSKLKVRSCVIDGEAIVVDERGLSTFDLLRSWRHDHVASAPVYVSDNPNGQHHHRRPADSIAARRRIYDAASRPTERCDLKGSGAACVRFIAATPRSAAPAADDLCARVLAATPARSRLKCFHRDCPSNFAQSPNGMFPKSNPILLQWDVGDSVTS